MTWLRNEVITNNIANADTPGFKVSEVRFEDILVSAISGSDMELKTTREGHIGRTGADIGRIEPTVEKVADTSYRFDENNVYVEAEMLSVAENSLEYYTLVSKINSEFNKLTMAIKG